MRKIETLTDLGRALKQPPQDLKVLLFYDRDGVFMSIERVKTYYAIPKKNSQGETVYEPADRSDRGAIQVCVIE